MQSNSNTRRTDPTSARSARFIVPCLLMIGVYTFYDIKATYFPEPKVQIFYSDRLPRDPLAELLESRSALNETRTIQDQYIGPLSLK